MISSNDYYIVSKRAGCPDTLDTPRSAPDNLVVSVTLSVILHLTIFYIKSRLQLYHRGCTEWFFGGEREGEACCFCLLSRKVNAKYMLICRRRRWRLSSWKIHHWDLSHRVCSSDILVMKLVIVTVVIRSLSSNRCNYTDYGMEPI